MGERQVADDALDGLVPRELGEGGLLLVDLREDVDQVDARRPVELIGGPEGAEILIWVTA